MASVRRIALIAVLVCSLSLTGCVGLLGDDDGSGQIDTDEYDAESLGADAATSMSEAETYSFSTEQRFDVDTGDAGYTATVSANGTSDERADVTSMDVQTVLESGNRELPIPGGVYIEGDRGYSEELDGNWTQHTLEGSWSAAEQAATLLENASVDVVGTDSVGGHEVVVLAVDASDDAVAGYGLAKGVTTDPRPEDGTIQSSEVRLYVDSEAPHHVYQTEIEAAITVPDRGTQIDATFTRTYRGFGDDVDVERPEGLDG